MEEKSVKFYIAPGIIAVILLALSFFNWPYGFYTLLKFIITAVSVYYAYYLYQVLNKRGFWFWILAIIAVLFNPIIPIYLYNKSIWLLIDIVVGIFLLVFLIKFRKNKI